jgi:hypothetical protein
MLATARDHAIAHVSISSMKSAPLAATKVAVQLAQFIKSAVALQRHANASTLSSLNNTLVRSLNCTLHLIYHLTTLAGHKRCQIPHFRW